MARSRSTPAEVVAQPPTMGVTRRRKRSRWRKLWLRVRWPLLALGVLAVATGVDVAVRYLPAMQALQHGRDQVVKAQALLTGDLANLDQARVVQARSLLADAELDFGTRSSVLADGWIGGIADHLPLAGPQVEAARLLRTAGEDGTAAGSNIVGLVEQLVPSGSGTPTQSLLQRLVTVAQGHKADLTLLSAQLSTLRTDIAALPEGRLLGPLDSARQTLRDQASKVLSTATPAVGLLQALPAAIGSGKHTYLLLLENPGEMRPGGGYIGAVGQVTLSDGVLTDQVFRDSAFSDPLVRSIPAPRAFNLYLQHGAPWNLGDTDWSTDFPTQVGDVERMYAAATGVHPDGVIAVDPIALGGILTITGPLSIPPYPQVVTGANALTELNYITNKARPGDPGKMFLPPFGQAMVGRLLHATIGQSPAIAQSLETSALQKHVVLFFADAHLEDLARGAGFDGSVAAPLGDSLEVADANLGGNKGDLYVTRHFSLQATVGDNGQVKDQLTLTYTVPRPPVVPNETIFSGAGADYRDYVQVLVPETAQFDSLTVSINGAKPMQVGAEAITYDFHRQEIAYWLVAPKGGTSTLIFTYEGPFADISHSPSTYSLAWQRQISALTWPIDVAVTMPKESPHRWRSDTSVDRSWTLTAAS